VGADTLSRSERRHAAVDYGSCGRRPSLLVSAMAARGLLADRCDDTDPSWSEGSLKRDSVRFLVISRPTGAAPIGWETCVLVSEVLSPPQHGPLRGASGGGDERSIVNRQYKRMMKREEQRKAAAPRPQPRPAGPAARRERTRPREFLREVVAELRKVAWPTRQEVAAYSLVVLVSVVVIAAVIFVMDFVFTKAVLTLFGVDT
jgi:preprotein translocase subunit SecE